MKLNQLLTGVKFLTVNCDLERDISSLTMHSDEASSGSAFFAIRGEHEDGNNYIHDALVKGACIVFSECKQSKDIPHVVVEDIRQSMGIVASNFYNHPEKHLKIISVVGTNGKTTTCHIIAHILRSAGKKTAVIGTLGADVVGELIETDMTTPDPLVLFEILSKCRNAGVQYVVMEVTAHAIYYRKFAGIVADVGVFTNISQDHLDFFKDMDRYSAVKESYFVSENVRYAVLNADDALGRKIYRKEFPFSVSYGVNNPADTFALDISYKNGKMTCLVNALDIIFDFETELVGIFNVCNILAAVTVAILLGIEAFTIHNAIQTMKPVEGRFNMLVGKKKAVIDFAHTPDGLRNLLQTAREITKGKIILVFGCGGNRDTAKREIMGEIAGTLGDFIILTEDNSRDETTGDIIAQIERGVRKKTKNYVKMEDRAEAITYGILVASNDDLIVIAGKGGEKYIEKNGVKREFSDKQTVMDIFGRYDF